VQAIKRNESTPRYFVLEDNGPNSFHLARWTGSNGGLVILWNLSGLAFDYVLLLTRRFAPPSRYGDADDGSDCGEDQDHSKHNPQSEHHQ